MLFEHMSTLVTATVASHHAFETTFLLKSVVASPLTVVTLATTESPVWLTSHEIGLAYANVTSSDETTPLEPSVATTEFGPVEVYGNKFFNSKTGDQFFLMGIAYQPSRAANDVVAALYDGLTIIDPMADPRLCLRDLPYLSALGVNTIRVYSIDTEKDHDVCFKAYQDAGIYVIADLSEPGRSINRESPSWDLTLFARYRDVVDSLQKYDNILGFIAGNEVTNDKTNTGASPFVKSSIRDIKEYIRTQNYRAIPVGYSTNDDAETRDDIARYFACGDDTVDFYGINMYEWCGFSSFHTSGYRERTEEFKDYPVPVFFSEFGCNLQRPRPFTEVEALFGSLMTQVWSGGLAYMYFEEPNEFGVVEVTANGGIKPLPDFYNLQKAFSSANPRGVNLSDYKASYKLVPYPKCPGKSNVWKASNEIPQSPNKVKCDCMESTLKCRLANIKETNLPKVFDFVCDNVDCSDIRADGVDGKYGVFSDCSSVQKASFVLNELFKKQGGGTSDDCDFNGVALLASKLATLEVLETNVQSNGETCAAVLGRDVLSQLMSYPEIKRTTVSSKHINLHAPNYTSTLKVESKASTQRRFYSRIVVDLSLAFVFVLVLTVFVP
ncbi:GAS2 [Cyberlindnera jadinii]|uniref:1,3-beta-glucanosyltransferase n=1 Tax=Cyberlindnera jadinii (strain ATCC 18201 / CBS 1600 / BCRC 20928 / JCM 3617 / NBRC 0987 / NRRL Y-1542) TaxID=983966 RepID=A0A0H5BY21_CYBJN|nr:GAS2 [Cyberlindnera jadinii]